MKYILVVIFLQSAVFSFGQESFGVKGGVNFNTIHIKNFCCGPTATEPNIGYHLGVYLKVPVIKQLSFIPEAQFSQRGVSYSWGSRLNLYYFEVPLLFSYSPVKWVSIDAGPNAAIKLASVIKNDDGSRHNPDAYKGLDFGLATGARFHIHKKLSIVSRYYFGLSRVGEFELRNSNNNLLAKATEYNRNGQLGISYLLHEP
jgi:hypothetical protein